MATKLVFLNCPFDPTYGGILNAIVFCVLDTGFVPRCALERQDSTEVRLEKICGMISECDYAIHDISYAQLDPQTALPRFNMPFELGVFLGCKKFGGKRHFRKQSLILDAEPYRYQKFLSDIAGQDIQPHQGSPEVALGKVRDWLRTTSHQTLPGSGEIWGRYLRFQEDLPAICQGFRLLPERLTYSDFAYVVRTWLRRNPGI